MPVMVMPMNFCKLVSLPMLLFSFAVTFVSCDHDKDVSKAGAQAPISAAAGEPDRPKFALPPDQGPPPAFDSARAMQYVKDIVAYGPRPLGSANHTKVEEYILAHLKGDTVENDVFTADTPEGKFPVHNIVAKFPGTKDGIIVMASHYDTNYPLRNTAYVGANDGGSSSALLLECANQFRGRSGVVQNARVCRRRQGASLSGRQSGPLPAARTLSGWPTGASG